jgi:hypothetical protein
MHDIFLPKSLCNQMDAIIRYDYPFNVNIQMFAFVFLGIFRGFYWLWGNGATVIGKDYLLEAL